MYKVFIDNKAIFFLQTDKIIKKKNVFRVSSKEQIASLISDGKHKSLILTNPDMKRLFEAYFEDHEKLYTAGGIVQKDNEFLVIKRNGIWDLPKGKVETGETKKKAAIREIEEECGISNPQIVSKLGSTYHTYQFKGRKVLKENTWYHLIYDGKDRLMPQEDEGITQVKWVSKKKLYKLKSYPSIEEVILIFKAKFTV